MISAILTWLRRMPVKAQQPPPQHYVNWSALGVGGSNTSVESINAEWQGQIFKQLASGRFFEIRI
jgi:hypothetical protein